MFKIMENNSEERADRMNEENINLIRKAFKDNREIIEETPEETRKVEEGIYPGGYVYTTADDEFIDLEIQMRDYDIEDHVNYIEFAEALYKKHGKKVNVYVYCDPSIKINIKLYEIMSDADFKIRLAQLQKNSMIKRIKTKIKKQIVNNHVRNGDGFGRVYPNIDDRNEQQ